MKDTELKRIRKIAGFTQINAAQLLGITNDYLNMIENNRRTPSTQLIERMAKLYHKKPEEIFLAARGTYCTKKSKKVG